LNFDGLTDNGERLDGRCDDYCECQDNALSGFHNRFSLNPREIAAIQLMAFIRPGQWNASGKIESIASVKCGPTSIDLRFCDTRAKTPPFAW
jgi:hypothetical protein